MKRSCKYCGRIHDTKFDCGMKPKRRKTGDTEAEKLRNTYRWRDKREKIRERDHYLCRWCLTHGRLTYNSLEVHHIVPIEVNPDLALDDDNLITLCSICHEKAERGEIEKNVLLALAQKEPKLPKQGG